MRNIDVRRSAAFFRAPPIAHPIPFQLRQENCCLEASQAKISSECVVVVPSSTADAALIAIGTCLLIPIVVT